MCAGNLMHLFIRVQGQGRCLSIQLHKNTNASNVDIVLRGLWETGPKRSSLGGSAGFASTPVLILESCSVKAKFSRLGRRSRAPPPPSPPKIGLANHSYLRSHISRFTFDASTAWGPLCEKNTVNKAHQENNPCRCKRGRKGPSGDRCKGPLRWQTNKKNRHPTKGLSTNQHLPPGKSLANRKRSISKGLRATRVRLHQGRRSRKPPRDADTDLRIAQV